jgi:hypothetical protein
MLVLAEQPVGGTCHCVHQAQYGDGPHISQPWPLAACMRVLLPTGVVAHPPALAGEVTGSHPAPSGLRLSRRLAANTAATVSGQLTIRGTDVLVIAGVVPSTCTGGAACGNTNGNSNIAIVDPGVEFGFFDPVNRMEVDIASQ